MSLICSTTVFSTVNGKVIIVGNYLYQLKNIKKDKNQYGRKNTAKLTSEF